MTDETRRPDPEAQVHDAAEPEILEVEGLPEDAPPPAGTDRESSEDAVQDLVAGEVEADEVQFLRRRVASLEEDLLRVRADFENFRKRQDRERSEFARLAAAELVRQVLPVIDNFRRALDEEETEGGSDGYRKGVQMIFDQLQEVLRKAGLTPIETAGQPFDPTVHEAVEREETTEVEANTVTEELEPGYLFQDRLLKPALVRVAVPPQSS